jgi:hypothetical protein
MARRGQALRLETQITTLLGPVETKAQESARVIQAAGPNPVGSGLNEALSLLTPAELASVLRVSPETVRRRMRIGKQETVEVLGVKRITAESATDQLRARVVSRLPARYRTKASKSSKRHNKLADDDAPNGCRPNSSTEY